MTMIGKYRTYLMGLAILWIMLYHGPAWNIIGLRQIQETGYSGVEIFLLLSSYGLYYAWNREPEPKLFYRRRIVRIIPYYLPVLSARIFWDAIICGGGVKELLHPSFWWHHAYFRLWYVPFIIFLYAITPLYLKIFKKDPKKVTVIGILAAFIFSYIGYGISSLFIATARIPVFLLGFYPAYLAKEKKDRKRNPLVLLIIVIIAYGLQIILLEAFDHQMLAECGLMWFPLFAGALPLLLLGCRCMDALKLEKHSMLEKGLSYLGEHTLELYLLHQLIYEILAYLFNASNSTALYIAAICLTVAAGGIYQKGIKKCMYKIQKA